MDSGKASLLLAPSSLCIQKTILLLHKNVKLVNFVQWYGIISLMPGLNPIPYGILSFSQLSWEGGGGGGFLAHTPVSTVRTI